jgi:hypothetical protein
MPPGPQVSKTDSRLEIAKKFADTRAQIDDLNLAALRSRRNIQAHNGAKTGTIHACNRGQVENNPWVSANQAFRFGFKG